MPRTKELSRREPTDRCCNNCAFYLPRLEAERDALRGVLKEIADGDPIYWTFERARLVARAALASEDRPEVRLRGIRIGTQGSSDKLIVRTRDYAPAGRSFYISIRLPFSTWRLRLAA